MGKKQLEIDGFGRKSDPELDELCQTYLDLREDRRRAEKLEEEARDAYTEYMDGNDYGPQRGYIYGDGENEWMFQPKVGIVISVKKLSKSELAKLGIDPPGADNDDTGDDADTDDRPAGETKTRGSKKKRAKVAPPKPGNETSSNNGATDTAN